MSFLGRILDTARLSPGQRRAKELAKNDYKYLRDLIEARRSAGLTQADVADRMGISQQAVSKLEKYDSDPRLSTLRRYAHAVEAMVEHRVTPEADLTFWQGQPVTFIRGESQRPAHPYMAKKQTDFALAS